MSFAGLGRLYAGEGKHVCPLCARRFHTARDLRVHKKFLHDEKRNVNCSLCYKKFYSQKIKTPGSDKEMTIQGEKALQCPACSGVYGTKRGLQKHMNKKHPELPPIQLSPGLDKPKTVRKPLGVASFIQFSERLISKEKAAAKRKLHGEVFYDDEEVKTETASSGAENVRETPSKRRRISPGKPSTTATEPLTCSWCERTFSDESRLRMHTASEHGKTLPRPSVLNERTRQGLSELALTPQKTGSQTTLNLNPKEYAAIEKEILSQRRLPWVDLSKDRPLVVAYLKRDDTAKTEVPISSPPKEPVIPTPQKETVEPKPKPVPPVVARQPPKAVFIPQVVKQKIIEPVDDETPGAINCFVCCMAFMANDLEAHVRQKHKRFPRSQCFICGRNYSSVDNLRVHVKTVHLGLFNFQCPKCPRAFFYYPKLIKHLVLSHHCDDIPPREECRIDNSSLRPARREPGATIAVYQQHVRDGESRCLACRTVVPTEHMKKHVDEQHTSFPRTRCYLCGARFDTAAGVEEHVRRVHFGENLHTCPECEEDFEDINEWREHLETVHERQTMYKCEHCGRAFGWRKFLRCHIREHHPGASGSLFGLRADFRASKTTLQEEVERQLSLAEEKKAARQGRKSDESAKHDDSLDDSEGYSQSMSLMEYQYELADTWNQQPNAEDAETNELKGPKKAINVDFFGPSVIGMCPICKKILHGKKSLKTHIEAIHHQLKRFACDLCDRAFYARCDLRKHIECVHNGVKPFSCNECGKGFFLHSQLAAHLVNKHKATLPFKCNECGRRYAIKQVLNDHMYRFHTDKPKRVRVNGDLQTPSILQQPSPAQPAPEVAQAFPTSQSEIYIIGNQIYFAENLVSVAAVDSTSDGTVDPSTLYETIQIDGQPTTIAFEQPTDGVQAAGYVTDGSVGPLIALDVNNSETILHTEDLEHQTVLAGAKPQTVLTTAAQVEGAEATHTLQPALIQGPDGVSMQQVYLAYQPY
ncbi:hypothetical protein AAHC03_0662 [Spirometra sp. Aus1]